MSTWDEYILTSEPNVEFLDDLASMEDDEILEAVRDAVTLALTASAGAQGADGDEYDNGLAAATIAAIWAGAPFSAGEVVASYPYIRELAGVGDEALNEKAAELLEDADTEIDLEPFLEALA